MGALCLTVFGRTQLQLKSMTCHNVHLRFWRYRESVGFEGHASILVIFWRTLVRADLCQSLLDTLTTKGNGGGKKGDGGGDGGGRFHGYHGRMYIYFISYRTNESF